MPVAALVRQSSGHPSRAEDVADKAGAQNAQIWTTRHMIGTKSASVHIDDRKAATGGVGLTEIPRASTR